MDLSPVLLGLRHGDDQHTVLHFGGDGETVDLLLLSSSGGQRDLPLEGADPPLALDEVADKLLVAGAVDDAGDLEEARVGVPVDPDVVLLGAGQGEVQDVGRGRVEEVDLGVEVLVVALGR